MPKQMPQTKDFPPEVVEAIKTLAAHARIMAVIVPEGRSDEFCARLSTYISFLLDTGLPAPMFMPAVKIGTGLECPYCRVPVRSTRASAVHDHARSCEFRKAIERWAMAGLQVDDEFGKLDS